MRDRTVRNLAEAYVETDHPEGTVIKKTEYVVGLAFDVERERVVLIEKNRPPWQRGMCNGVGGHIDNGETPEVAISREFTEETGVEIAPDAWDYFLTIKGNSYTVYFFRVFTNDIFSVRTTTDEKVSVWRVYEDNPYTVSNLSWVIPLALDDSTAGVFISNKK